MFVLELAIRVAVYRTDFLRDPWRIFDLFVIGFALLPTTGSLSVLRALRILRVLRLISIVPSLRRVVTGFITALPGMGSIMLLLGLVFYVFAVMATKLYGSSFPELFGGIPELLYTLFQIYGLRRLVGRRGAPGHGGLSDRLAVLHPVHHRDLFHRAQSFHRRHRFGDGGRA